MKIWEKETGNYRKEWSRRVEEFTIGRDQAFDLMLAPYDVQGSIAHARMLAEIGLLSEDELPQILEALGEIGRQIEAGAFGIEAGVEDVHSQVELMLTRKLGDLGKKIHTGRSRNDQVLLDIKLFLRAELKQMAGMVRQLFGALIGLSEKYQSVFMPGYTHFQAAMPSSFGLWFGAYAESLCDDMECWLAAYNIADKNPLGSGAGYGSSFPLDRALSTRLLHFGGMNYNSLYASMTRGKTEKTVAMAMSMVAATLSKFSYDVCLYMSQNYGFISFPDELTTGSSIMPHKKNPDVFELIRARCNRLQALPNELTLLTNNLPSGYHRDLQLSKEILFPAIQELKDCLQMTTFMLENIEVKTGLSADPRYNLLFSVESVNELVRQGIPFRDAYRQVGMMIKEDQFKPQKELHHTHIGSIGNLANESIREKMKKIIEKINL
jgi:argininosuccinate lyase